MTIDTRQLFRVARRLREATGYFELDMMQHALDCLEGLGELGPFEAEVELLRGVILRRQNRFDDARAALKSAASPCAPSAVRAVSHAASTTRSAFSPAADPSVAMARPCSAVKPPIQ